MCRRDSWPDLRSGGTKKEKATKVTFSLGFRNQQLVTVVATAAVPASASTAAATTTAVSTATKPAAAATFVTRFTRSGLVYDHGTAIMLFSIEPFDGFAGFLVRTHFDERETLRPTCHTVTNDFRTIDLPEWREQRLQIRAAYTVAQVPNI
jgi:hypothetical protein